MKERQAPLPPTVSRIQAAKETSRMASNPLSVFSYYTDALGETYYYYFGGSKRVLVTSDPHILKHILKDNFDNYRKSEIQTKRMRHFLGNGLLTSHGDQWLRQRRLIQQGFRPSALAVLAPAMHTSLRNSLSQLDAAAIRGPVRLSSEMMTITFSMVAHSLFGARMTGEEIKQISRAITTVQAFMVRQIVRPYLAPWYVLSGEQRRHETARDEGFAVLRRHILRRRMARSEQHDLLQILLDAVYDDTGKGMSEGEILSESMQLLVAGHETSSNALAWTLYLLCRHPEYLLRARAEFDAVVGSGPLEYAHIPMLKLNTHILEEALRLYPPFWMVDRMAIRDDMVGDFHIKRGTTLIGFLYGAHHSPKYWAAPERFLPERFEGESRKASLNFTFLPFGGGPRGCVGGNYAMLQMLIILSVLLRQYDFALAANEPEDTHPMFILRPRDGILAHVTRRNPGYAAAH